MSLYTTAVRVRAYRTRNALVAAATAACCSCYCRSFSDLNKANNSDYISHASRSHVAATYIAQGMHIHMQLLKLI